MAIDRVAFLSFLTCVVAVSFYRVPFVPYHGALSRVVLFHAHVLVRVHVPVALALVLAPVAPFELFLLFPFRVVLFLHVLFVFLLLVVFFHVLFLQLLLIVTLR